MNGFVEAGARQMRQALSVVAVGLVRLQGFQGLIRLAAFDANDGRAEGGEAVIQHRRHPTGLEHDALARRRFAQRS